MHRIRLETLATARRLLHSASKADSYLAKAASAPLITPTTRGRRPSSSKDTLVTQHKYANNTDGTPTQHPRPADISARVNKHAELGKIDEAIELVQRMPKKALNVPVWNTLLLLVNKAEKYSKAWSLFNAMKKAGFAPSYSTYSVMLEGLSKIEDFTNYSIALTRANTLFNLYMKEYAKLERDSEPGPSPLEHFIKILGATGDHESIWETYFSLGKGGTPPPTSFTFSAMQLAFINPAGRVAQDIDKTVWSEKVVEQTKTLWNLLLQESRRRETVSVDAHCVAATLRGLSFTPSGVDLATQIIREHLGLQTTSDQDYAPSKSDLTPFPPTLNTISLQAAVRAASASGRHWRVINYARQIFLSGNSKVIDARLFSEILRSFEKVVSENPKILEETVNMFARAKECGTLHQWRAKPHDFVEAFERLVAICAHAKNWPAALRAYGTLFDLHLHKPYCPGGKETLISRPHKFAYILPSERMLCDLAYYPSFLKLEKEEIYESMAMCLHLAPRNASFDKWPVKQKRWLLALVKKTLELDWWHPIDRARLQMLQEDL